MIGTRSKSGISRAVGFTLIILMLGLLAGCAGSMRIDRTAFTKDKTYAVVVFAARERVAHFDSKAENKEKEANRELSIQPVLARLEKGFLKGFKATAPVKIKYGKSVLNHPAYKKTLPTDKAKGLLGYKDLFVVPRGYHFYWSDDAQKLGELARALGVDGVIILYNELDMRSAKTNLLNQVTVLEAAITPVFMVYDRQGRVVLRGSATPFPAGTVAAEQKNQFDLKKIPTAIADHAEEAGREAGRHISRKLLGK